MNDTYLVTGGSGFIGGYVVKALVERGDDVVVFSTHLPNAKMQWLLEPIWDKVIFIEGSISDGVPFFIKACKDYEVTKVFHAATSSLNSFKVTLCGMLNVCETARILNMGRIVFAGTNVEYIHLLQNSGKEPLTEMDGMFDPSIGVGTYAASKMAATIIGMSYWQTKGVDWVSTRFTRVWGFGAKTKSPRNEVIIENAVDGIPLIIPRDGDQKRNNCYIKDLARGIILALDVDGKKLKQRVFNLGGSDEISDKETVAIVKELISEAKIEVTGGGENRRPIDSTSAREQLLWKPVWDFRDAVEDYISIYTEFKKSSYVKR